MGLRTTIIFQGSRGSPTFSRGSNFYQRAGGGGGGGPTANTCGNLLKRYPTVFNDIRDYYPEIWKYYSYQGHFPFVLFITSSMIQ